MFGLLNDDEWNRDMTAAPHDGTVLWVAHEDEHGRVEVVAARWHDIYHGNHLEATGFCALTEQGYVMVVPLAWQRVRVPPAPLRNE